MYWRYEQGLSIMDKRIHAFANRILLIDTDAGPAISELS